RAATKPSSSSPSVSALRKVETSVESLPEEHAKNANDAEIKIAHRMRYIFVGIFFMELPFPAWMQRREKPSAARRWARARICRVCRGENLLLRRRAAERLLSPRPQWMSPVMRL